MKDDKLLKKLNRFLIQERKNKQLDKIEEYQDILLKVVNDYTNFSKGIWQGISWIISERERNGKNLLPVEYDFRELMNPKVLKLKKLTAQDEELELVLRFDIQRIEEGREPVSLIEIDYSKIIEDLKKASVISLYSGEKLENYSKKIFRALMDKSLKGSICYDDFWQVIENNIDDELLKNVFISSNRVTGKYNNTISFEKINEKVNELMLKIDKSTGSIDATLASTKRALKIDAYERIIYQNYLLDYEQRKAVHEGYIYVHDMGARRDSINCCLFDMESVLNNGFEMGDTWYNEPQNLREAFDVIASVTQVNASLIYGGFTIPEIDNILSKYAEKSYNEYLNKYKEYGLDKKMAQSVAEKDVKADFDYGFKSLEYRFNTVISGRGDYPFITITFGICKNKFAEWATKSVLETRRCGQGKDRFKKPVLFPKIVFLYDEELHGEDKELEYLFDAAIKCSSEVMYPEYLSLSGEDYVSSIYKRYKKVISPMCCRAFLSPWYKEGGRNPKDANDEPIYIGRFNVGVVSLNLPMIYMKAKEEERDFFDVLGEYMDLIRGIHRNTFEYLKKLKASSNPVAFTQGGFYGGNLKPDDTIEELLKTATVSFGITALNELEWLANKESLKNNGSFALKTMEYISDKIEVFIKEDDILYNVYGTPAESLCGKQVDAFRRKYGEIENVSNRKYFSNSFHCHVSEDITPIEKQEVEVKFWDYFNGGKIQYVRIDCDARKNPKGLKEIVKHAMKLGLYEGINNTWCQCSNDNCGETFYLSNLATHNEEKCPVCGCKEYTKIERMCGYLAYTRIKGETRLNDAKMAEIEDRICM